MKSKAYSPPQHPPRRGYKAVLRREAGVPVLEAYWNGSKGLIVYCEHCSHWHVHGAGKDPLRGSGDGPRTAHCPPGEGYENYIIECIGGPDDLRTQDLEAYIDKNQHKHLGVARFLRSDYVIYGIGQTVTSTRLFELYQDYCVKHIRDRDTQIKNTSHFTRMLTAIGLDSFRRGNVRYFVFIGERHAKKPKRSRTVKGR